MSGGRWGRAWQTIPKSRASLYHSRSGAAGVWRQPWNWTYFSLNRGVLFIPFFNMIITSPYHSTENCERVVQLWDEVIASLFDR